MLSSATKSKLLFFLFLGFFAALIFYGDREAPILPQYLLNFFIFLNLMCLTGLYRNSFMRSKEVLFNAASALDPINPALDLSKNRIDFGYDVRQRTEELVQRIEKGREFFDAGHPSRYEDMREPERDPYKYLEEPERSRYDVSDTANRSRMNSTLQKDRSRFKNAADFDRRYVPQTPEGNLNYVFHEQSVLEMVPNEWPKRPVNSELRRTFANTSMRRSRGITESPSSQKKEKRVQTISKSPNLRPKDVRGEYFRVGINVPAIEEAEFAASASLASLDVNYRRFKDWTEGEIQKWTFNRMIPEIVRRNLENLKLISDLLRPFSIALIEHEQFLRIVEGKETQPQSPYSERKTRQVYIDDLIRLQGDPSNSWGPLFQLNIEDSLKFSGQRSKLESLLNERVVLDDHLCPKGYREDHVRLGVFRQIVRMQNQNSSALENPADFRRPLPSMTETLLNAFVCLAVEGVQKRNGGRLSRDDIFIEDTFGVFPKNEADFVIETVDRERISCYSGRTLVKFFNSIGGAFGAIVFFAFHLKYRLGGKVTAQSNSAFALLMAELNLRNELYVNRFR